MLQLNDQDTQTIQTWRAHAQALLEAWQGLQAVDMPTRNALHRELGVTLLSEPSRMANLADGVEFLAEAVQHLDRLGPPAA